MTLLCITQTLVNTFWLCNILLTIFSIIFTENMPKTGICPILINLYADAHTIICGVNFVSL